MSTTPTPQSDQAATTPGRAEELAVQLLSGTRRIEIHTEAAALLRAQSAELLALRALLTKFQKIAHESRTSEEAMNALFDLSEEVDAALNSPTQKSPAK